MRGAVGVRSVAAMHAIPEIETRRDALVERLFTATLGAFDLCAVYVGDRLGLYRALASNGPMTVAELASQAQVSLAAVGPFLAVVVGASLVLLSTALGEERSRRLAPLAALATSGGGIVLRSACTKSRKRCCGWSWITSASRGSASATARWTSCSSAGVTSPLPIFTSARATIAGGAVIAVAFGALPPPHAPSSSNRNNRAGNAGRNTSSLPS